MEDKIEISATATTSNTSDAENIKSKAVVKYSVPKPTQFNRLQCNTDLNLPPSNWLSSSADSYGFQQLFYQPKGFTSFRMAHMFPDCVGDVDVVSDAENIKKLLKIPYHKGHISMMVHRVENTLLLDDFDIYKHILRNAETEWQWFRKFFFETVNSNVADEERNIYIKNKRRKALLQKSLISKFLYHSLVQNENDVVTEVQQKTLPLQEPLLPEPSPASEVPNSDTSFNHKYNRNVVWTFEDIEMLIGTDLPIFGGGTHPCISLRLRDMNKPINVLTGIDYWLDNLMSNVPEVVMCYHLNGIVKKYELIKTEDLPRLNDSKFSPKLIRDVAQSILSFLKSNATKAGHTYWLFKGKDEEVVKLYDLTSLCSEQMVDSDQNPFTVPVAMLLYRVARNMKNSKEKKQLGTIRMLLKNCLKLLSAEQYPEIVTSSHYMLSDIFIPSGTNPDNPILDNSDTDDAESVYDDDDLDDVSESTAEKDFATKILILNSDHYHEKFDKPYKPPPPIQGTLEERCLQAIGHIAAGLNNLKYFKSDENINKVEEEIPMAKPFVPIPMPYSTETKDKTENKKLTKKRDKKKKNLQNESISDNQNALLLKNKGEAQPVSSWQEEKKFSWKERLRILLYEKAGLVYATLAEKYFVTRNYGNSLRCIGIVARCMTIFNKINPKYSNVQNKNCVLGRAGDCCIMMVQSWEKLESFKEQFHINLDDDLKMIEQLERDEQMLNIHIADENIKCVFIYDILSIEQMLLKGVECYQEALKSNEMDDSILRRLGNSLNEVGSFYLNRGKTMESEKDIFDVCKKAEMYLKKGLEIFEKVKDDANIALLYTNMGHLHRLLAHASTPTDRGEITNKEKMHYTKAFTNYKKALQVLGERKYCPGIWDTVKWELSTALFTLGSILHENPPSNLSKSEAEKEVIETWQKALQYCDMDENNSKHPLYQYRAALIHFRLGSLYHNNIWTSNSNEGNRKHIIQLAKTNYEKASKLYFISSDVVNYLTSQMQRFALNEFLAETTVSPTLKLKHLQTCLNIIIELIPMLKQISNKKIEVPDDDINEFSKLTKENKEIESFKNCSSLIILVKQRLQYTLRLLIKLCMSKPQINKESNELAVIYKTCYSLSFVLEKVNNFYLYVNKLVNTLCEVDNKIRSFDM